MSISSEIVTADNQDVFVDFLKQERKASYQRDRNADWFKYLLDKDFWKIYPMWTMSRIDGEVWAIAAVQKHSFPTGTYRVMSRLYVKQEMRKPTDRMPKYQYNGKTLSAQAKSTYLFPPMLDMIKSIEGSTMIMTMEHIKRTRNLNVISSYFNEQYGTNFSVQPHMYQTFDDPDNWKSWQVLTADGDIDLPYLTQDEWKHKFPNSGRSIKGPRPSS
jgi:hypothetical protein